MATAIHRKQDALKKFINSKIDGIKLIQEDKNTNGAKKFYVVDPKVIYEDIISSSISHYYESWADNTKILFSLDLDIPGKSYEEAMNIVKTNITKVCHAAKKYYDFEYDIETIIVLESQPEVSIIESKKYSYHVIFRGLSFQNNLVAKDFFKQANKEYDLECADIAIYGLSCLRLCYCSKAGKKATLYPIDINIDGKITFTAMNSEVDDYQFFLRTMITHILPSDIEIKKSQMFEKIQVNTDPELKENFKNSIENLKLEEALFSLPSECYDDYSIWTNVGLVLAGLETEDNKYYDLWNEWSKQSDKYQGYKMKKTWSGYLSSNKKPNLGCFINICRRAGLRDDEIFIELKVSFKKVIESYPKREIKLNTDENTIIIDQPKLEPDVFIPHIKRKLLALQSEKGTGKTSNLFRTFFEIMKIADEKTTMLFISSRRTFGIKLLGDLQQYGFVLYSDIVGDINSKKVICQIDSLSRINTDRFDYVIVDECESVARYISSTHFTKNPKANNIVGNLVNRIEEAKQVIIMDADLSNRCMEYYKNVMGITNESQMQLIINKFKAFADYKMISMEYNDWLKKILEDIEADKKLVIPMASNNKAKDLKTKIEKDFPEKNVLLIHKETQDSDKIKNLSRVNETWVNYDIVIYTPSVCMGVSFDIPDYFDAIYGYGCDNSLGAQEFCQMLHRVREPKNKIIYISMNNFKEFNEYEDLLTFEDVEEILTSDFYLTQYELHNNLVQVKYGRRELEEGEDESKSERILKYPYKNEPCYRLFVHNSLESIENKLNFAAVFYGYVKEKEYIMDTFAYKSKDTTLKEDMKDIRKARENSEIEIAVQGVLDAPDIDKEEFVILIERRDEFIDPEDIQKINRYRFRACYNIEGDLTYEIIEKYNVREKMKWYYNMIHILSSDEQTTSEKLDILKKNNIMDKWASSCYLDFTAKNTYTNHKYVIDLINYCGFDFNKLNTIICQEDLINNMNNCINYLDSNKAHISDKFGLKIYKKEILTTNLKERLRIINNILHSFYGYKIKRITKNIKVDSNKNQYILSDGNIWDDLPHDIEPCNLTLNNQIIQYNNTTDFSDLNMMDEDED